MADEVKVSDLTSLDEIKAELAKEQATQNKTDLGQVNFNLTATPENKTQVPTEAAPPIPGNVETQKLIGEAHKQAIIATIQNKDDVKEKVLEQAEKSIDNELKSLEQENIARLQQTTYDANKEACSNYGINSNVPLWQVRLMKIGSAIWFVIY